MILGLLVLYFATTGQGTRSSTLGYPIETANTNAGDYHWAQCADKPHVDCGWIIVPKDYLNSSAGTVRIALTRVKASKRSSRGTVFLNPGGPGGSGFEFLHRFGDVLAKISGNEFDLIGFDPRGIGLTRPVVQCFRDAEAFEIFKANTVIEQGFTVPSITNLSSPTVRDSLIQQYREFLALHKAQAELCRKRMGQELRYMSTTTVVRDLDFMAQKFDGEDAPINYWGRSYGTVIGSYLVNMLPHRVGRVVIDGVVDPINWSNEPSHKWPINWLAHAEKTYENFLDDCSKAGPSQCPLAHEENEPWQNIEHRLEEFLDKTALEPIPVPLARRAGYLTSGSIRGLILRFLYSPLIWPLASTLLSQAMNGDGSGLFKLLAPVADDPMLADLPRLAVSCLDSPTPEKPEDFPTVEELADQGVTNLLEVSPHFGMSTGVAEPDGGCQFWPARPPERFTGPWHSALKIPMLIIANTADPITPITSAMRVHNSLNRNSSIIVIQDGPGHCSVHIPSLCTAKSIRQYFVGDMPRNGTVCPIDVPPFPDSTHDDDQLNLSSLSSDDAALLKDLKRMAIGAYEPLVKSLQTRR